MKKMIALALISAQWLCGQPSQLDHRIESEHFQMYYAEADASTALALLQKAERTYATCSVDFQHSFDKRIVVSIYPSLEAYHEARGLKDAPDWLVSHVDDHAISIVSPSHPGPAHTKRSLNMILQLDIAQGFIYSCFGKETLPRWLVFGTAAKEGGYFIKTLRPRVPSLEELQTVDDKQFAKVGGFQWSHLFVSFIEKKYGWDKLLQLLANYKNPEEVLGVSINDLFQQWIDSAEDG